MCVRVWDTEIDFRFGLVIGYCFGFVLCSCVYFGET